MLNKQTSEHTQLKFAALDETCFTGFQDFREWHLEAATKEGIRRLYFCGIDYVESVNIYCMDTWCKVG